ncbi:hypothetical protein [Sutterella sp.]|uniref:hypothetical protein n=1 Tax=Sutterella sp. TaxID=1981025 RepID=UPI003FD72B7A
MADSLQRADRATHSGVKTDALPPFDSAHFLQGSSFAEERRLGFVLNVLASNDPAAVAALSPDLQGLVDDVADGLKFVAVTLARPADASQKTDPPTAEECRGLGSIVGLLADVLQVVSAADIHRANAEYRLRR